MKRESYDFERRAIGLSALLTLVLVILCLLACTRCAAAEITDAELDAIPKSAIVQTLRHLQAIVKESGLRADVAEELEDQTRGKLLYTQGKLELAEESAKTVEADRDAQAKLAARLKVELSKSQAETARQRQRADAEAAESSRRGNLIGWVAGGAALLAVHALLAFLAPMLNGIGAAYPPWKPAIFAAKFLLPALAFPSGYFGARLWLHIT